ncbi:unnamed protein product [Vitrella brassicaformis CCMP3155]|uniref:O-methyltransferase domain-containing protein n=1 Tax=Vitrella brassicaformis (strain CCMP3155) TaxID=1169540 RepID=A0A0G4F6M0_VITBC|nr:unnamed protein product [Vitrella brassicaformis CCMP3155]|eukprot:CEM07893.1 unnamed protein product [Vitrella brassicaformis CCMP3155]
MVFLICVAVLLGRLLSPAAIHLSHSTASTVEPRRAVILEAAPLRPQRFPETTQTSNKSLPLPLCAKFVEGDVPPVDALLTSLDREVYGEMKRILADSGPIEGGTYTHAPQVKMYMNFASISSVNTICETGFNGGHSSFIMLNSNPKARVISFDLCKHEYVAKVAQLFSRRYGGRFSLICGNSRITLPKFHAQEPHVGCDLMLVDGGRLLKTAIQDLLNFREMASPRNILILDDCPGYAM